jgi:hypothetical protein
MLGLPLDHKALEANTSSTWKQRCLNTGNHQSNYRQSRNQ